MLTLFVYDPFFLMLIKLPTHIQENLVRTTLAKKFAQPSSILQYFYFIIALLNCLSGWLTLGEKDIVNSD